MSDSNYAGIDGLGTLLDLVPELSHLVDTAMSHSWSASKFQNAVEDSQWWRNHSATARAVIIQQANDPKSYQQSVTNTINTIQAQARQMGFTLDAHQAHAIAVSALMSGNDSNQHWITQQIGRRGDYGKGNTTADLSGGMATTVGQLQQMAAQYGFKYTTKQLLGRAQQIVMGNETLDTYQQDLKNWAASAFPPLSSEIQAGKTVSDLAAPYISSMSQLLEIDPGTIDTFTPLVRKAMQGVIDPATNKKATMTLDKFEEQVRSDPRWARTQNAKDTMGSVLVKLGNDFGFGGF